MPSRVAYKVTKQTINISSYRHLIIIHNTLFCHSLHLWETLHAAPDAMRIINVFSQLEQMFFLERERDIYNYDVCVCMCACDSKLASS